jgi:hypothetical protein
MPSGAAIAGGSGERASHSLPRAIFLILGGPGRLGDQLVGGGAVEQVGAAGDSGGDQLGVGVAQVLVLEHAQAVDVAWWLGEVDLQRTDVAAEDFDQVLA